MELSVPRRLTVPAQPAMLPTSHDPMNKPAANLNVVQRPAEAALAEAKERCRPNSIERRQS